jgi:hypothetical protein
MKTTHNTEWGDEEKKQQSLNSFSRCILRIQEIIVSNRARERGNSKEKRTPKDTSEIINFNWRAYLRLKISPKFSSAFN